LLKKRVPIPIMNVLARSTASSENLNGNFAEALTSNRASEIVDGRLLGHAEHLGERTDHSLVGRDLVCCPLGNFSKPPGSFAVPIEAMQHLLVLLAQCLGERELRSG